MIWKPFNKILFSKIRKASRDYQLIEEGDRIAVSLSGGKDSNVLLYALSILQKTLPCHFDLKAVTIDMGWGTSYDELESYCEKLGVPLAIVPSQIGPIVFEERKEKNPCSLCARMRRGAVNRWAHENNCNKVALGHHMDDVIETVLMSLFYEGRLHTFAPKAYLSRMDVTVIRPLVLVAEVDIKRIAQRLEIPIVDSCCPANGFTMRSKEKNHIAELEKENPLIRERMLSAVVRDMWNKYDVEQTPDH